MVFIKYFFGLGAAALFLSGCSSDNRLKEILYAILPLEADIELVDTCSEFFGPAVVLFSGASFVSDESVLGQSVDGLWVRSSSLAQFSENDAQNYQGVGVSATLLDGKDCLRDLTDEAEEILFGDRSGLYFRSENRQFVAVIFDKPVGHGVMFIKAP